jgi:predicted transcriptional regulator
MKTVLALVTEIVSSHASNTQMTKDQLLQEIQDVYAALSRLESAQALENNIGEQQPPALTVKQAFKKDEVICMECSKGGFKTLKKHLSTAHGMTTGEYRKKYGIKSSQKLAARSFSESRRKAALERGMTAVLAGAREIRMSNLKERKAAALKSAKPIKPINAAKSKSKV